MLESKNSIPRDFSRFDKLSTEELREIIRQDSMLAEDEESDMDAILYIMGVLANREKEENIVDVKAAWQSFKENYYPYDSEEPLYQFNDLDKNKKAETTVRRHWRKPLTKIVSIAAAICLILLTGTVTAYALGYNLWGAIAVWTQDTFGFYRKDEIQTHRPFPNLSMALDTYGITGPILPTWLPEGYEEDFVEISEVPVGVFFSSTCKAASKEVKVSIYSYSNDSSPHRTFESNGEVKEYSHNGIMFYIMKNDVYYRVVWAINNNECSILCSLQEKELFRMIDSINER